jgi:hypothetical protein
MRGVRKEHLPSKTCPVCGREFTWRKKWERHWETLVFCSDACRRGTPRGGTGVAAGDIEALLLRLAVQRGAGKTFCPSEAARALDAEGWRTLMPQVRAVGAALVRRGALRCTQGGEPVTPDTAAGPIRFQIGDADADV